MEDTFLHETERRTSEERGFQVHLHIFFVVEKRYIHRIKGLYFSQSVFLHYILFSLFFSLYILFRLSFDESATYFIQNGN